MAQESAKSPLEDLKLTPDRVETSSYDESKDVVAGQNFDPALRKRTVLKLDLLLLPILTLIYLGSSLDRSNLGNAKTLGMIDDIGVDKNGDKYAFLNSLYYIGYAPLMVPLALLGKRTRMSLVLATCATIWGIAATCFAAVQSFGGAYACRFIVGAGEAGFAPVVQVYMSRFYTRQALGMRIGLWLTMMPLGGFLNGIIAYGVAFIKSKHLESWRILFLIEGSATFVFGLMALLLLPESIETCRWLTAEEKEYLLYERSRSMKAETNRINWKHAREVPLRWQQMMPVLIYMCQQITGSALSAYLPTFTQENGFKGANAQIATLAPYGAAMVSMVAVCYWSDRIRNRGWPSQTGWWAEILGFSIYLGVPVSNHAARFASLILAESGHFIATALIVVWAANNAGSESRRSVSVPLAVSFAQAVSIGSGYLFPKTDAPKYRNGFIATLALSCAGSFFTLIYQALIHWENKRRDKREGGPPEPDFIADTNTYADDAPGFRYMP